MLAEAGGASAMAARQSVAARVRAHDMENNKAEHDRCPSAAERKKDIHPIGAEELYQKTLTKIVIAASANTGTSATGYSGISGLLLLRLNNLAVDLLHSISA